MDTKKPNDWNKSVHLNLGSSDAALPLLVGLWNHLMNDKPVLFEAVFSPLDETKADFSKLAAEDFKYCHTFLESQYKELMLGSTDHFSNTTVECAEKKSKALQEFEKFIQLMEADSRLVR
ncbi:hypothetical protein RZ517_04895 [Roseovarius sp. S88]|uniref:Uncharacterized protein n=1 Tax=Roseovarius phycicola TaxID=3080976 RepID=A0ABZ2HIE4_9RHOB